MAGRNYIPLSGLKLRSDHRHTDETAALRPHRRLSSIEVRLIEDRVAAQSREIETLLIDNQRLANSHLALKQDVVAAQLNLRRLSDTASSIKAERDAQVREVYERSLKLEAEARPTHDLSTELSRVRAEIQELRAEREQLSGKLKLIEDDIAAAHPEQQEFSELKTDIEATQREIRKGRSAVEYERKMHSANFGFGEVMENHLISMAHEAEKLRYELANAEKRAMAALVGADAAANPGHGYAIHLRTIEHGFGGNSLSDHNVAAQQGTFDANTNYVHGGGPHIPHGQYGIHR